MEERLIDLETRLAFQEDAIQELNTVVADQQRLITTLRLELDGLKARLRELTPSPIDGGAEPPPPHY